MDTRKRGNRKRAEIQLGHKTLCAESFSKDRIASLVQAE